MNNLLQTKISSRTNTRISIYFVSHRIHDTSGTFLGLSRRAFDKMIYTGLHTCCHINAHPRCSSPPGWRTEGWRWLPAGDGWWCLRRRERVQFLATHPPTHDQSPQPGPRPNTEKLWGQEPATSPPGTED